MALIAHVVFDSDDGSSQFAHRLAGGYFVV